MIVPAGRLEALNVATPLTSVALPIVPFWSLKVTVPPVGVAPPADRSLTVAVKAGSPETAEAVIAVSVGRALRQRALFEESDLGPEIDAREKSLRSRGVRRLPDGSAGRESAFNRRSVARSWCGAVMVNALQGALHRGLKGRAFASSSCSRRPAGRQLAPSRKQSVI